MAVEQRRACGYRKVGGLYLVGPPFGLACGRLPWPLRVCPTCGEGFKPSRGWTWVTPANLFVPEVNPCRWALTQETAHVVSLCLGCPLREPRSLGARAGLLWVGERFYKTPAHFTEEASRLGISKRIATVPRGFKAGETWVLLAHPKCLFEFNVNGGVPMPGIFKLFVPQAIEQIITATKSKDTKFMADLEARGIQPVIVPDDDADHQGGVYDEELQAELPLAPKEGEQAAGGPEETKGE